MLVRAGDVLVRAGDVLVRAGVVWVGETGVVGRLGAGDVGTVPVVLPGAWMICTCARSLAVIDIVIVSPWPCAGSSNVVSFISCTVTRSAPVTELTLTLCT